MGTCSSSIIRKMEKNNLESQITSGNLETNKNSLKYWIILGSLAFVGVVVIVLGYVYGFRSQKIILSSLDPKNSNSSSIETENAITSSLMLASEVKKGKIIGITKTDSVISFDPDGKNMKVLIKKTEKNMINDYIKNEPVLSLENEIILLYDKCKFFIRPSDLPYFTLENIKAALENKNVQMRIYAWTLNTKLDKIIFVGDTGNDNDININNIYSMSLNSQNGEQPEYKNITNFNFNGDNDNAEHLILRDPTFTSDEKYIVSIIEKKRNSESTSTFKFIFVDSNTGQIYKELDLSYCPKSFSISPDGKKIVYSNYLNSSEVIDKIFMINLDENRTDSQSIYIADNKEKEIISQIWSPNGEFILFTENDGYNSYLKSLKKGLDGKYVAKSLEIKDETGGIIKDVTLIS